MVVEVDVDAPDVVEESAVEEELVDAGWVAVGLVTATAVEAEDESLLLHAAMCERGNDECRCGFGVFHSVSQ